jgi:hypothetical protein
MFRRILIGSGLLFALFSFFATGNIASAASPSTNANNAFAAMQKTCAVIHIQLNGTQNTLTCLKSRGGLTASNSIHNASVSPYLTHVGCNIQGVNVVVWSNEFNYPGTETCFSGIGYTGVHITNVNTVYDTGGYSMWLRYYGYNGGGGTFCTLYSAGMAFFGGGDVHTNVLVTQLAFGDGANGGSCPS